MTMQNETKQEIADKLATFPSALDADDIEDFCSLAQYYASRTPQSFRRVRFIVAFHSCYTILLRFWCLCITAGLVPFELLMVFYNQLGFWCLFMIMLALSHEILMFVISWLSPMRFWCLFIISWLSLVRFWSCFIIIIGWLSPAEILMFVYNGLAYSYEILMFVCNRLAYSL